MLKEKLPNQYSIPKENILHNQKTFPNNQKEFSASRPTLQKILKFFRQKEYVKVRSSDQHKEMKNKSKIEPFSYF